MYIYKANLKLQHSEGERLVVLLPVPRLGHAAPEERVPEGLIGERGVRPPTVPRVSPGGRDGEADQRRVERHPHLVARGELEGGSVHLKGLFAFRFVLCREGEENKKVEHSVRWDRGIYYTMHA